MYRFFIASPYNEVHAIQAIRKTIDKSKTIPEIKHSMNNGAPFKTFDFHEDFLCFDNWISWATEVERVYDRLCDLFETVEIEYAPIKGEAFYSISTDQFKIMLKFKPEFRKLPTRALLNIERAVIILQNKTISSKGRLDTEFTLVEVKKNDSKSTLYLFNKNRTFEIGYSNKVFTVAEPGIYELCNGETIINPDYIATVITLASPSGHPIYTGLSN